MGAPPCFRGLVRLVLWVERSPWVYVLVPDGRVVGIAWYAVGSWWCARVVVGLVILRHDGRDNGVVPFADLRESSVAVLYRFIANRQYWADEVGESRAGVQEEPSDGHHHCYH